MKQFRTLYKVPIPNIVEYIREYMKNNDDVDILVGCDSQSFGNKKTVYGVVVVLYTKGKGGHVLCYREVEPIERNTQVRLITEVWKSIEIAEFLRENDLPKIAFIDIDLNPDPKYKSNTVLRQAIGMVEGMGYSARCKKQGAQATYAANYLVRN
jgi:uncharacterized protein